MSSEVYTVSEVVGGVKVLLEDSFSSIVVKGEVTNLSQSGAGHFYFSLSDGNSLINCCFFKNSCFKNPYIYKVKNGDEVILHGGLSVYARRGSFQLIGRSIFAEGLGKLKIEFELLKRKLASEGLFDLERKGKLPKFYNRVAVITALQGAALQDFLKIFKRRALWYDILILPALVQGSAAPKSLLNAFNFAQAQEDIDVIVLTRGGGSLEDLWAFNDEALTRAVASCAKTTISAVGHEVDTSLTDLAADIRAETPSAAAEVLTEAHLKIKEEMRFVQLALLNPLKTLLHELQVRLHGLNPEQMALAVQDRVQKQKRRLERLQVINNIERFLDLASYRQRLDEAILALEKHIEYRSDRIKHKLAIQHEKLNILAPQKTLDRGYSYLSFKGKVIDKTKKVLALADEDRLSLTLRDGRLFINKGNLQREENE